VPNFLKLIAALLSRPFPMPHSLQVHSSTLSSPRPFGPAAALQLEQICVDGENLLATTIRPLRIDLGSRTLDTKVGSRLAR
jgi:hypothetical protein